MFLSLSRFLSEVTVSNATIDDVVPYEKRELGSDERNLESRSKVLVHFVDTEGNVIPVEQALE